MAELEKEYDTLSEELAKGEMDGYDLKPGSHTKMFFLLVEVVDKRAGGNQGCYFEAWALKPLTPCPRAFQVQSGLVR